MALKVTLTHTTALYSTTGYFVQWTLDNARESGNYRFDLYRSGTEGGPWEEVQMGMIDEYSTIDPFDPPNPIPASGYLKPNLLRFEHIFYYRLVVTSPSGETAQDIMEGGPHVDGFMRGYQRKAQRDFRLTLKYNGVPVAILKRKQWGTRCPVCFDKMTKEVMRSNCKACFGTGFTGGYWTPIQTWARRGPSPVVAQVTPEQKSDSNEVKIWTTDLPLLERDDVVVFIPDQRRYRIDQQYQTEIRVVTVHQVFSAQEFPHDHVIYRFPVDLDQRHPLY